METTLRSFLSMRTKRSDDIVDGEPGSGRIGLDACDERAQPALMVVWWMCLFGSRCHERADAAARFENARPFELGVHARDGIGVHAQLDRELTDCRKLFAHFEAAGGNSGAQGAVELRVDGGRIA
jgi:hypothetical protein